LPVAEGQEVFNEIKPVVPLLLLLLRNPGNKLPGPPVIWAVGLKRQLTEEKLGSIKQYLSGIEKEINQRFN
jgi:hypothetical protein